MRKDVVGYEGIYVIDGLRVISLKFGKEKELKPVKSSKGYLIVCLCKDGKVKNYYVHRLIAEAYIPNPDNKPYINHKNGNKTDNRIENLEWVTSSENNKHAYDSGLRIVKQPYSVILKIFEMDKQGYLQREIAKETGYTQPQISHILNGKQRKL